MPNASGELLATDDHPDEREKIYAVASQLDWFVIIPDTKEHNHKWKSSADICIIRIDSHKDDPEVIEEF